VTLTFAGTLDRAAVVGAVDALDDLVSAPAVAAAWDRESALAGLSVGGLVRHLVSQPECAVAFLREPPPAGARTVSLLDYYARADWLHAPLDAPENTSIRDQFTAMARSGHAASVDVLRRARADLPAAIASAGPTTYVPWQDCSLDLDDFLVCRLLELVVHADDLAVSLGRPTPQLDDAVRDPVVALLAVLSLRRHGQDAVVRALARAERAGGPVSAF
jgi:hypothetical protein